MPLPISRVLIENKICIMRWGELSPVNYRLSTGEEKLPECNILRSGPGPCFALLSSIDGLAGRSGEESEKLLSSQSLSDQNA